MSSQYFHCRVISMRSPLSLFLSLATSSPFSSLISLTILATVRSKVRFTHPPASAWIVCSWGLDISWTYLDYAYFDGLLELMWIYAYVEIDRAMLKALAGVFSSCEFGQAAFWLPAVFQALPSRPHV